MFTAFIRLLLVIVIVVQIVYAGNDDAKCICSSRTRNKGKCFGELQVCDSNLARAGGVPVGSKVCLYHRKEILKSDQRCCCPSTWGHGKSLHRYPIPTRMYSILDEAGKKRQ